MLSIAFSASVNPRRGFFQGVHTTLRQANDRGFECLLLSDCCGAAFPELHFSAPRRETSDESSLEGPQMAAFLLTPLYLDRPKVRFGQKIQAYISWSKGMNFTAPLLVTVFANHMLILVSNAGVRKVGHLGGLIKRSLKGMPM